MTGGVPHVLLVNPWIHDFAAYDFWAKPYGLLSLGALLRAHGIRVSYVDCLDRFHTRMPPADLHARHGRGPYLKTPVAKPGLLADVPRTYSRYGIPLHWFLEDLDALRAPPDLILITALMTYWYPGLFETIAVLKKRFPNVPVVLGGIYARLCPEHARKHSGADRVVTDDGRSLLDVVAAFTGYGVAPRFDPVDLDAHPYPAFDLQHRMAYIPLLTMRGCPFDCAYCASRVLEPEWRRRSPRGVVEEIAYWHRRHGVVDFVFYDDALLVDAEHHALPLLEAVIRKGWKIFFHTPNALHIRGISAESAVLMQRAGFHTVRLGLETTDFGPSRRLDRKVAGREFEPAVDRLKAAGFGRDQIGAYLLVGLPGQSVTAVEQAIREVQAAGAVPILAHYSPIPRTRLWPEAVAASRYDLAADPVLTNNAVFPCMQEDFSWRTLSRLKALTRT